MSFVHLHNHTPFSFLDGASDIEKMVNKTLHLEMPAMAITDHNNMCAMVKFSELAQKAGIKPIQGVEISLEDSSHLTLLAKNNKGYAYLCSLLSNAYLHNERNNPLVKLENLANLEDVIVLSGCRKGKIASSILQGNIKQAYILAKHYMTLFGQENFYIELQDTYLPGNRYLNHNLIQIAESLGVEVVATNNTHYCEHDDFIIHDLLTCIRTLSKVQDIHPLRPLNGENYIKSPRQMQNLFSFYPKAISNTLNIAEQCEPVWQQNQLHFPHYYDQDKADSSLLLRELTYAGAKQRYKKITSSINQRLEYELKIIEQMGFADYFLLVWDLAKFARYKNIRYAGRGSAADSLVAYCLYITEVDSLERGLLFERFMSPERSELPDIDIDFEARYRNQIIDYIYKKYGTDKVARVATYNTFKARSAIKDVGKALGFTEYELGKICKKLPHTYADNIKTILDKLPELKDSALKQERFKLLLDICEKIAGFPRFLGTHIGGVVISDCPLTNLTPLQPSALGPVITQFDKDDVEKLGLVKLDLLSLRTLSVVSEASRQIKDTSFDYDSIPLDDQATYDMIANGETIGVFQLESPAQRALQSRLEANQIEDVIHSMALIRPGPIKGNMVEPYIKRRQGQEDITYLHPRLKPILEKTYGVILFQEQVMEIATEIAGFTPGEADQLRRVMTHARSQKTMDIIGENFVAKSIANGISAETAKSIFFAIAGYASYGFCEAHAAAFATTSFKTAYLVKHYPAQYFTAILNHQPMGYYPPNVICNEARRRGIKILPVDINISNKEFTVEEACNIRIGLQQVKGISKLELDSIIVNRRTAPFSSLSDLILRTNLRKDTLANLAKCGGLDSIASNRREALILIPLLLEKKKNSLLETSFWTNEEILKENIVDFSPEEKRYWEYNILGLDIKTHFMSSFRYELQKRNIKSSLDIKNLPNNTKVSVSGLPLRPHRPPTRSGKITVFFQLEDEFGLVDIIVFEDVYMKYGKILFGEEIYPLIVKGNLQKRGRGINIIASHLVPLRI